MHYKGNLIFAPRFTMIRQSFTVGPPLASDGLNFCLIFQVGDSPKFFRQCNILLIRQSFTLPTFRAIRYRTKVWREKTWRILPNFICQTSYNSATVISILTFSPNFISPNWFFTTFLLPNFTVPTVYEYLLYITLYLTCKFIIMLYIGVYYMQVLIINMFTQNSSPLVKSTMMSLLLMILRRSSDVIQWYSDTVGNNETAGNSSNIVMCSLLFMR